jgi:chitin disaccharide deacetylase
MIKRPTSRRVVLGMLLLPGLLICPAKGRADDRPAIQLIVRGDDIGSTRAANEACLRCAREGIVRSVEVMVCAPWFNEAAKLLRENPQVDTGVHLTLTSEWENYKWGPLTESSTLVDAQGHFFPMTAQRPDFPPHTGFLEAQPRIEEVERELRAQIELARRELPNVTHLSCHMYTALSTPELRQRVADLSKEYNLPLETPPGVRNADQFSGSQLSAQQKTDRLVQLLEKLEAGTWLIVEHPGLDTPEMRGIGHRGYENVAEDRAGVTAAFTSERVKAVIERRHIQLVSYGDVLRQ